MNKQLISLAKNSKTLEQFIITLTKFPKFYLRTEAELRMTKKDFRELYQQVKGGN